MSVEASALVYAAAGSAALLVALLPRFITHRPVSMPMVFLGLGVLAYALIGDLPDPDPVRYRPQVERLTEVCVIIALFGAGLAIDRPPGLRRWRSAWMLLAVTMPLSIAAVWAFGHWVAGFGAASALLLAAALAPTDPVLASDVQVGEPTDEEDSEDEPRFALTAEAGMNDALAFPFVYGALLLVGAGSVAGRVTEWVLLDVVWRIAAGLLIGWLVGRLIGRVFFRQRRTGRPLAEEVEGFVALACTLTAYGVAEVVEGYGFVAVFVCALTIRAEERDHGYHGVLHGFIEQVERLLTAGILVLLGGALARGLLDALEPVDVVLAVGLLLVVRPLAAAVALIGGAGGRRDRTVMAFFGVRGIGSIYYLAYALGHGEFEVPERLWAVVGLVILLSVLVHGLSATPVMRRLDRRREAEAHRQGRRPETNQVPV